MVTSRISRTILVSIAALLVPIVSMAAQRTRPSTAGTSGTVLVEFGTPPTSYNGNDCNQDVLTMTAPTAGAAWSATVQIPAGHYHGGSGLVSLRISHTRNLMSTCVPSAMGGRLMEDLLEAPIIQSIVFAHDGSSGTVSGIVAPRTTGLGYAVQATILGGGYLDLSNAVYGTVQ